MNAETLERIRAGLDAWFGTAGGCHDLDDARAVARLVASALLTEGHNDHV